MGALSYAEQAAAVIAAGGTIRSNEYGTPVSVHICETCGQEFTLCPPSTTFGPNCLDFKCPSYDIDRDPTCYFLPDDPDLIEGNRNEGQSP